MLRSCSFHSVVRVIMTQRILQFTVECFSSQTPTTLNRIGILLLKWLHVSVTRMALYTTRLTVWPCETIATHAGTLTEQSRFWYNSNIATLCSIMYSSPASYLCRSYFPWCGVAIGRASDLRLSVAGSSPGWAPPRSGIGQATYTCVPQSPSSIIWYRPRVSDALWLASGKVTAGLAESDSLPLGFMTKLTAMRPGFSSKLKAR